MMRIEDGITAALAKMTDELRKGIVLPALKEGAAVIRDAAAAAAPRSDKKHEHLADHIAVAVTSTVDGERLPIGAFAVAIGPTKNVFWGIFSEYGTVHESARPWLRPAYDANQERALGIVGAEIWNRLSAAAAAGTGPAVEGAPA
jgi:HK97 gp10 family phage protein